MPRAKKNPVTDTPIMIDAQPVMGEPGTLQIESEPARNTDNVLSIVPNSEASQNRDTSQIDQWLSELGINFI